MQKIFGILFILLAVWIAIEVYTEGTDRAFGGLFASHSPTPASAQTGPLTDRVHDRVSNAMRTREERTLQQTDPEGHPAEQ